LNNPAIHTFAVSAENIFIGTEGSGVFLSTNNGTKWDSINSGLTDFIQHNISALTFNSAGLFAGTAGGLYLSTNNGTSWNAVNTQREVVPINCLAVSDSNLFVGTSGDGIYHSTNNGLTWDPYSSRLGYMYVSSFTISGVNLFAGTNYGAFLSIDNGNNWNPINTGLTSATISTIFAYNNKLVAATFNGNGSDIYLSTNNGSNWAKFNTGLTSDIYVYDFISSGNNIYAATSQGVWRRPINELIVGVEQNRSEVPTMFSLSQNYPNPFNPTTNISFIIPTKSFVTLKIFDALGREVAMLVNGYLSVGSYTKQWNAKSASSGIYYYSLVAGSYKETKKLVLLR
jgi:hypothetical protein